MDAITAFNDLMDRAPFATVADGLREESLVYSHLQGGPEFAAWRAATPRKQHDGLREDVLRISRIGNVLRLTLNRPAVRNALNVAMRDAWLDALAVAQADPALTVVVDGAGPSFCSGGDLDEFGTFPSPEEAHEIRLATSIGAAIDSIKDRVTFLIHGAAYGSGIELAAFASKVIAAPDTTIALPEIGIGLIPGAGGTVSITNRIGVEKMRALTLSRQPIDAETALAWGLIDAIS